MMDSGIARLRYLVATRHEALLRLSVLLVLVAAVGVGATLLFPPTTEVADVTDRFVVETETGTHATVDGDFHLYDRGERLVDEPVYVRAVAPTVTVTASTSAPPDDVEVEQRLSIVYEASSDDGVFRRERQTLAKTADVTDGDAVRTNVTLAIDDVEETLLAMENEIGDAGDVTAYLRVETAYDAAGGSGTAEDRAPLEIGSDSYVIPTLSASEVQQTTETVERPIPDRVFRPTVPSVGTVTVPHTTVAFLLVGLVGAAAGVLVFRLRESVDPVHEKALVHRHRYDEWISTGELPPALAAGARTVPVATLEDLVDVAIDAEGRIIHDPSQNCYAVITGDVVYVFVDAVEESTR